MRRRPLHNLLPGNISRKRLFAEALLFLLLARLSLFCLPFKIIRWFLNRPTRQPELTDEERKIFRNAVRWSILRAAGILPGTVCFPRGIAAQAMLRRRGIAATLYYGATTKPDNGLVSHVWVRDGQHGVIGCRRSDEYKIIAKYPE